MRQAHSTRLIEAAPETIWALVSDVTTVANYHPSVKSADLLSPNKTGLGAARRCNFYDGTDVREEVIEIDEGRRLRIGLSEFSLPMRRIEAETAILPTADGKSQVTFTINYEVKYGIIGKLLGATVVRKQLTQVTAKFLAGIDHYLSTGQVVDQNVRLQVA
jgi:ribosome-associated toxin RatA of RatAB toxin-antitoxin module